jgi:hypothetical protein
LFNKQSRHAPVASVKSAYENWRFLSQLRKNSLDFQWAPMLTYASGLIPMLRHRILTQHFPAIGIPFFLSHRAQQSPFLTMSDLEILSKFTLGDQELNNRIVLAPMTRAR